MVAKLKKKEIKMLKCAKWKFLLEVFQEVKKQKVKKKIH